MPGKKKKKRVVTKDEELVVSNLFERQSYVWLLRKQIPTIYRVLRLTGQREQPNKKYI